MGTFLVYILKSAVCLAMFYLFYRLSVKKLSTVLTGWLYWE